MHGCRVRSGRENGIRRKLQEAANAISRALEEQVSITGGEEPEHIIGAMHGRFPHLNYRKVCIAVNVFREIDELLEYLDLNGKVNDTEKDKIQQELQLVKARKWEKYFVMVANIITSFPMGYYGGSSQDSYLLWKIVNPNDCNDKLINSQKAKEIFENDALRLFIDVVQSPFRMEDRLRELDRVIETQLSLLHLYKEEFRIPTQPMHCTAIASQKLIVSEKALSKEELGVFKNERKVSTAEERETLYRGLIITINIGFGI